MPSFLDEEKIALIDQEHCFAVNYETYFFATLEEKQRFSENILRYCGIVTDPVSQQRFRPNAESPRHDLGDHPYFFLSDEHRAAFVEMPEEYAKPVFPMLEKDSRGTD